MAKKKSEGINFFQKYLTIWVFICMVVGVIIGKLLPAIPNALGNLEISGISIPIAILIWIMIYPMMLKVDFQSIKQVGKNPKGLFITWNIVFQCDSVCGDSACWGCINKNSCS